MSTPLHVLLIEDSQGDTFVLVHVLRRGGYEPSWQRVDTAGALDAALTRQRWDLVICDWVMPNLSAPAALACVREHDIDVPIIVVSGELEEQVAATATKAGAQGYVSKFQLTGLLPVVARELRYAEERRARH
jgi:DNA-binding NtrC family response regulator